MGDTVDWQHGTAAGANNPPFEAKLDSPRRLDFAKDAAADAEDEEDDAQRTPRLSREDPAAELPHAGHGVPPTTSHRGDLLSPGQSATDAISSVKFEKADRTRVSDWPQAGWFLPLADGSA